MAIGKSFWLCTALAASGCLAALNGADAQQTTTTAQAAETAAI
jgi:hypothetical protein